MSYAVIGNIHSARNEKITYVKLLSKIVTNRFLYTRPQGQVNTNVYVKIFCKNKGALAAASALNSSTNK